MRFVAVTSAATATAPTTFTPVFTLSWRFAARQGVPEGRYRSGLHCSLVGFARLGRLFAAPVVALGPLTATVAVRSLGPLRPLGPWPAAGFAATLVHGSRSGLRRRCIGSLLAFAAPSATTFATALAAFATALTTFAFARLAATATACAALTAV